jgi:hypothetical protein
MAGCPGGTTGSPGPKRVWKGLRAHNGNGTGGLSGSMAATKRDIPHGDLLELQTSAGTPGGGGPRAGFTSYSPPCRTTLSSTSVWCRSMKLMMRIVKPHFGQHKGSGS